MGGRSLGGRLLLVDGGFEPSDVLAEDADFVSFFYLSGLLAQAELEKLLAGFAELGFDLGRREFANFFGSHGAAYPVGGYD